MRKELLTLIVILLTSFTSTSQSVTPPDSIICLPTEWVKNIVIELEEKDLCEIKLEGEKVENVLLMNKLELKDSIIDNFKIKEENYNNTINSFEETLNLKDKQIDIEKKKAKKTKFQRNIIGIGTLVLLVLQVIV